MSIWPIEGTENQKQGFWSPAENEKYSLPQQIILSKNKILSSLHGREREKLR